MGKPRSRLIDYQSRVFRRVRGFTTEVHFGKQSKHLIGRPEHTPGRSVVTLSIIEIQDLVEEFAGTGSWRGKNKEVIDFGKTIGYIVSGNGVTLETTKGTVHYSKTGAHLVPLDPTV